MPTWLKMYPYNKSSGLSGWLLNMPSAQNWSLEWHCTVHHSCAVIHDMKWVGKSHSPNLMYKSTIPTMGNGCFCIPKIVWYFCWFHMICGTSTNWLIHHTYRCSTVHDCIPRIPSLQINGYMCCLVVEFRRSHLHRWLSCQIKMCHSQHLWYTQP